MLPGGRLSILGDSFGCHCQGSPVMANMSRPETGDPHFCTQTSALSVPMIHTWGGGSQCWDWLHSNPCQPVSSHVAPKCLQDLPHVAPEPQSALLAQNPCSTRPCKVPELLGRDTSREPEQDDESGQADAPAT